MAALPKHPRDLNQWQRLMIDMARGFAVNARRLGWSPNAPSLAEWLQTLPAA